MDFVLLFQFHSRSYLLFLFRYYFQALDHKYLNSRLLVFKILGYQIISCHIIHNETKFKIGLRTNTINVVLVSSVYHWVHTTTDWRFCPWGFHQLSGLALTWCIISFLKLYIYTIVKHLETKLKDNTSKVDYLLIHTYLLNVWY